MRLAKALSGHPDAGIMWEQHCDTHVREAGFMPVGKEWPSMYFHKELKLLLVIYVDDLKLAGPSQNLTKGWELLRSQLRIELETDLGLYLGCLLGKGTYRLHAGTEVTSMTYNMKGLLKLFVDKYLDLVGKDTKLKQQVALKRPNNINLEQQNQGIPKKQLVARGVRGICGSIQSTCQRWNVWRTRPGDVHQGHRGYETPLQKS